MVRPHRNSKSLREAGNAFWPTLFEVGLTPCLIEPARYATITQLGLGLTDLAKTVSGSDTVLLQEHFDREGLGAKMRHFQPKILVFTSQLRHGLSVELTLSYGTDHFTIYAKIVSPFRVILFYDFPSAAMPATLAFRSFRSPLGRLRMAPPARIGNRRR